MSQTVRAAAERYSKANTGLPNGLCPWEVGDTYLNGNIWDYLSDLEIIAKAYLAEHPAYDDRPATKDAISLNSDQVRSADIALLPLAFGQEIAKQRYRDIVAGSRFVDVRSAARRVLDSYYIATNADDVPVLKDAITVADEYLLLFGDPDATAPTGVMTAYAADNPKPNQNTTDQTDPASLVATMRQQAKFLRDMYMMSGESPEEGSACRLLEQAADMIERLSENPKWFAGS